MNQRESLVDLNREFLKDRTDILNGLRVCKQLETFLRRLDVDVEIIRLDWSDHEEWQYRSYRDRVRKKYE